MDKETFDYVAERAEILSTAGSSKQSTQEAAQAWLDAIAADNSDEAIEEATQILIEYLDGRPNTIESVLAFLDGPGKELFGEEAAAAGIENHKKRKEAGAKFCDCPSCTAASEVLAKFGRVEL